MSEQGKSKELLCVDPMMETALELTAYGRPQEMPLRDMARRALAEIERLRTILRGTKQT